MAQNISQPLISVSNYDEEKAKTKEDLQLFTNNPPTISLSNPYENNNIQEKRIESLEVETPHGQMTGTLVAESRSPAEAYCIYCKKNIITVTTFHTGRNTHIMGGLLCCLGFYCCCCCLPYHMKDCKDVRHRCPYCDGLITIKKFTIF